MKDTKNIKITNAFQEISHESRHKLNKILVDEGSEFHNRSMETWLQDNDIEIYSTQSEGKSVAAERFIRTLKNKIYKYITSILKNVYIDKLDDIVNESNNIHHRTIKMKPVDVKSSTYWREDVFVIKNVKNTVPWTYVIEDLNEEELVGTLYKKELPKTN